MPLFQVEWRADGDGARWRWMPPPMKAAASWDRRHTARNVEAIIECCAVAFIVGLVALNGIWRAGEPYDIGTLPGKHSSTDDH